MMDQLEAASPAVERFLECLEGVKARGGYYVAICPVPAHDDHHPSLSVKEGEDGRALVKCHKGCKFEEIVAAVNLEPRDLFVEDLYGHGVLLNGPSREHSKPGRRPETPSKVPKIPSKVYEIRATDGGLKALHKRYDNVETGQKDFSWSRPGGAVGLGGLRVADLPLYGSDLVAGWPEDAVVVLCEGEKAKDTLNDAGIPAVGTVSGASGTPSEEALKALENRDVVIWADNDEEGRKHMRRVAEGLQGIAKSVH